MLTVPVILVVPALLMFPSLFNPPPNSFSLYLETTQNGKLFCAFLQWWDLIGFPDSVQFLTHQILERDEQTTGEMVKNGA